MADTSTTPRAASAVLLGAPYVACGGEKREFLPERRFQLLAYLAYRGEWVTRDALAFLFWPDHDNAGARRNLRWLLHSVRALPEFGTIEAERERMRLALPTDVRHFESTLKERQWADAVALYRGALCTGLDAHGSEPFAKWLTLERGRLAELFRSAMTLLIDSSGAQDVLALTQRLLEQDPLDEYALRARLRALRELGRSDEAQRSYRAFSTRLMDELGLEPTVDTSALAHEMETPVAVRAPPAEPESSFVGRTSELAQIRTLLTQSECRLLTLIGPGGVGKSRLARRAVADSGRDQVLFVPLEGLSLPAQLPAQVARVIGLRLVAREDAVAQVEAYFQKQRCLVVFDNFEHLIDAADLLARWLVACPSLQVIVTSRERLDIPGEWLLPVEGLGCPRASDADRERFDAVQLFIERAQAAKRGFDARGELPGICEIVGRVEGMPLAIELAAAWVRLLPCADIAHDLATGPELLESDGAVDSRQRSVRASFDHSWALLTGRERALFASLSVFRGGFGREAVRHVAQTSLPAIAQLVDKSLVRVDVSGRFSLHPLLLQFGTERLAANAAEEGEARKRHAEFFAHWMEQRADLSRVDHKTALMELDVEIDNCLGAWDWAIEHKRADLVRAAGLALLWYFERKGLLREGLECFALAERLPASATGYGGAIGNVQRARATLSLRIGRYDEAEQFARDALHHFRVSRDGSGIKSSLTTIGLANWERARYAAARPYFAEGLKRSRADGDRTGEAGFLTNLALLSKADGRYAEAETLLTQAIEIYREIGDAMHQVSALNNLGNLCRGMGQPARGRGSLLESLAIAEDTGNAVILPFVLINLALVELDLGELDAARDYGERALSVVRKGADRQIEIGCHATLARIELARRELIPARTHIRAAALIARELKHLPHLLDTAVNSATALRLEGSPESAAVIVYMVQSHPSAGQPDRDAVERELAALRPVLPQHKLEQARADASSISLEEVISRAIGAQPPS